MRTRRNLGMIDAHLAVRRRLVVARREGHGQGHVANVMIEIEREIARLDAEILETERKIAQLPDDAKARHDRVLFWPLKLHLVENDKRQLRDLVAALKARREELAGDEGRRMVDAAKRLAEHLTDNVPVEAVTDAPPDPPIPPEGSNGHPRGRKWG